ncbi:MAG: FAD-dependent oxidoreductase [Sphaerochaetaceae bacterium]
MDYMLSGNNTIIEPQRSLPIRTDCDVLVAGGGTAGCIAALAAARQGVKTVLIEQQGSLGGTIINGAVTVHSFFNVYETTEGGEEKQVVKGIAEEIFNRIVEAGGSPGHVKVITGGGYDPYCSPIDHEVAKAVLAEMMEEAGVNVFLHSFVSDVIMNGNTIRGVVMESVSGREAILCKSCVDCTGNGDIAAHAGAPFGELHSKYSVDLTFGIAGIDFDKFVTYIEENNLCMQKAIGTKLDGTEGYIRYCVQFGDVPEIELECKKNQELLGKTAAPSMGRRLGASFTSLYKDSVSYVNFYRLGIGGLNPTDVEEVTRGEMILHKDVIRIAQWLRTNIPGFAQCYISWTAQQMANRASRIIKAEYDLSDEEICNATKFEDEIAYTGFHDLSMSGHKIKDAGYVGLPYRMLIPKKVKGLLVAGKSLTSEQAAHQCTRIGVACMSMGQAAGTAAALAVKQGINPDKIEVKELQKKLKEDGVYLE